MLHFKYFVFFQLTIAAFHLQCILYIHVDETFWQFYDMHIMNMLGKGNQTSAV